MGNDIRLQKEEEALGNKIKSFKKRHLMTWTDAEWDDKYCLKKSNREIWEKIKGDCQRLWPNVDLDLLMESYAEFGQAKKENGLYKMLEKSRNEMGKQLMANKGDNESLISLIRYLLGNGSKESLPFKLREGSFHKTLDKMEVIDPTVILLQFASADKEESHPYMLKYGTNPGDEDGSWLNNDCISELGKIIDKLSGGGKIFSRPPLFDVLRKELINLGERKMVRMDVINYVSGCLSAILVNSHSDTLNMANQMFMQNIVRIETPSTVTRWVTSYGHGLKMENRGNELRLTRYWNKDGKKYYKEYILIPYLDGRGSLRGYIETPDLAERLYLGENAHGTVAYTILKLSNKDDKVLLPTKSDDSLPVHKIKFSSTDSYMNLNQFLGTDEIELKGAWEEEEKKEDAICASRCNFPRNDHGVTTSSGYLYVPCKTQDKFENKKEEEEETKKEKVNIVTHWLRVPLWPEYTMLYGGTVQLWDLERNEYPALRIVHDHKGAEHHILHFAIKSVMVDVTKALSPKEGDVLDYGITVVDKPVERVQSYADRFSTIDSAEVVRNAKTGELEIKVTYRLISVDGKEVSVEVSEPAFTIIKR